MTFSKGLDFAPVWSPVGAHRLLVGLDRTLNLHVKKASDGKCVLYRILDPKKAYDIGRCR
ncbi:MAG TPA: hypothetical protein VH740_19345 [Vicinamibacterales bacterium]